MVKPFSSEHQYKLYWLGFFVANKLILVNLSPKGINRKAIRPLRAINNQEGQNTDWPRPATGVIFLGRCCWLVSRESVALPHSTPSGSLRIISTRSCTGFISLGFKAWTGS